MTKPLDTFTTAEIEAAIGVLNPRERRIFEALRLTKEPMTLEELALEFGVARERVRQIDVRALERVLSAIEASRLKRT
jgi:RNA polymerase sigma-32 factor